MIGAVLPVASALVTTDARPIEAVVFDMDGILVDSEPIWRAVEREVFAGVGIEVTEEDLFETYWACGSRTSWSAGTAGIPGTSRAARRSWRRSWSASPAGSSVTAR